MDAWEALDVDDSDLGSLLRPCKRQVSTISSSSGSPQPVVGSHPPASTTSSPLIPGPAGALQAAFMQRKTHLHSPLPTQDYLRRVAQEGFPDDDHDFKHHHWLLALDFVRRQGTIEETPLSFMRKCLTADRFPLVVAIIKSSTPNALGDLMVTLKDPTGTIGATIHHKVLTEGKFGRDISVGSVLILQKVTVFSPTRSTYYLNVSLSNVVKVFSTGSGSLLQKNHSASTVTHCPATGTDCGDKSWMPQNAIPLLKRRIEEIMNSVRQDANVKWSARMDQPIQKGSSGQPEWGYCGNENIRNLSPVVEKGPVSVRRDANKEITKAAVGADTDWRAVDDNHKKTEEPNDFVVGRIDGAKRRQPMIIRDSLPEWTDEQLDELFALDCDHDGSLF